MKTLDVGDVIERLEDIIEEWGPKAKGGDVFSSDDLIQEAKYDLGLYGQVKLVGFEAEDNLPVCLVGTLAKELGVKHLDYIVGEAKLTEDAQQFIEHIVCAVDGDLVYYWDADTEYPPNPTRSWRLALNRVLKAWELA